MSIVLVTGGARGIGKEISEKFLSAGHTVIINYNNSYEMAKMLQAKYSSLAYIYKADVGDFMQVRSMCEFIIKKFKKIDVLINNAGIAQIKQFNDLSEEDWDRVTRVNLKSIFNTTRNVIDYMIHEKSGRIINIASIWGEVGASCEVAYSTTKAGVIGFTKALSKELAPSGITVNAVSPGIIDTDMNSCYDLEELKKEVPIKRVGTPEDIANAVYFLADSNASYITGQVLSVNGGFMG